MSGSELLLYIFRYSQWERAEVEEGEVVVGPGRTFTSAVLGVAVSQRFPQLLMVLETLMEV